MICVLGLEGQGLEGGGGGMRCSTGMLPFVFRPWRWRSGRRRVSETRVSGIAACLRRRLLSPRGGHVDARGAACAVAAA